MIKPIMSGLFQWATLLLSRRRRIPVQQPESPPVTQAWGASDLPEPPADRRTEFVIGTVSGRIDLCVRPAHSGPRCDDVAFLFAERGRVTIGVCDGAGPAGGLVARLIAGRCAALAENVDAGESLGIAKTIGLLDAEAAPANGSATAAIIQLRPDGLHAISTGDSEAWAARGTELIELTRGQPRHRVGDGAIRPQVAGYLGLPDTLVVASDGLWKRMGAEEVFAVLGRTGPNPAQEIVAVVEERFGRLPDDIAVVVVEIDAVLPRQSNRGC